MAIYDQLFEQTSQAIALVSFEGIPIEINPAFRKLLGYSKKEILKMSFPEFTHPDDVDKDWNLFEKLRAGKISNYEIEKRYIHKNNSITWVNLRVETIRDVNNEKIIVAFIDDIGNQRKLSKAAKEKELLFRNVFEESVQCMVLINTEGHILELNHAALAFSETRIENLLNNHISQTIWFNWSNHIQSKVKTAIDLASQGRVSKFTTEVKNVSGVFPCEFSAQPIVIDNKVSQLLIEFRVLPTNTQLEKELLSKSIMLEKTEEIAKTGGWIWNRDSNKYQFSRNAQKIYGLTTHEIINNNAIHARIHPYDLKHKLGPVQESVKKGEINEVQYRYKTLDGNWIHIKSWGEPFFDSQGKLKGMRGAIRDVTDEVRAKEGLEKTNSLLEDRNNELRRFAYVASHDLQEPLRTISSFIQLLDEELDEDAKSESVSLYMDHIKRGSTRMRSLIRDLLEFARLENSQIVFNQLNPTKIIEEVLLDIEQIAKDKQAEINIKNLPETISACDKRLPVLFQNLITNALKFSKENVAPKITISYSSENNQHIFSVEDNGIGISQDKTQQVFEIFKRLHGRNEFKGTGIGLSLSKKIVEQHKGKIWIESELGVGTTVKFTLNKVL